MDSADLYAWLIEATLATSAAVLAVLALRKPLRAVFGAGACYAAWTAVPVALLATLLPAAVADAPVAPLDIIGVQRETRETGWSATMLLLLVDDIVVYKLWSGSPNQDERRQETNPLGPAQDLSGTARGAINGAIPKP